MSNTPNKQAADSGSGSQSPSQKKGPVADLGSSSEGGASGSQTPKANKSPLAADLASSGSQSPSQKGPVADLGSSSEDGGSGSQTPGGKKGKAAFLDKQTKGMIKEELKQVLGKLGNIAEVIVQKEGDLKGDAGASPKITADLDKVKKIMAKLEKKN